MMEDNVPGFPGYHVTRSGNVYSRRVERSPNKFRDWHLLKTTLKRNGRVIEGSYHKLLGLRISYYNI